VKLSPLQPSRHVEMFLKPKTSPRGIFSESRRRLTQCWNCEKLAAGKTFRRSETEQNCDINRMYTVYS